MIGESNVELAHLKLVELANDKFAYETLLHAILTSVHSESADALRFLMVTAGSCEASDLIEAVRTEIVTLIGDNGKD